MRDEGHDTNGGHDVQQHKKEEGNGVQKENIMANKDDLNFIDSLGYGIRYQIRILSNSIHARRRDFSIVLLQ